nr:MAG TPA: hypothetical protein [Bacteriophage sp.]
MRIKLSSSLWLIIHLVKTRRYRDYKTYLTRMIILFLKLHHR